MRTEEVLGLSNLKDIEHEENSIRVKEQAEKEAEILE
jgi:hypothetical protein